MLNEIDLSRLDLNLLVLFDAVFAERHVGRAADRLNLSPSAISHGLGRLRRLLNDPLFLRTPKGVVPSERALELAGPITDILAQVRRVVASAEPFDPATSRRRFTIGAPDAASAVFLPLLVERIGRAAAQVDLAIRQLLPVAGEATPERAWRNALADLDERALDLAVIPTDQVPARFLSRRLYDEDFVAAMRRGHAYAKDPKLESYCAAQHLLVSESGDRFGFVDRALAELGRSRRIALTVPNFLLALAVLAESELIAALPRGLVEKHGARFGLIALPLPVVAGASPLYAVASRAGAMDAGLAWLLNLLAEP